MQTKKKSKNELQLASGDVLFCLFCNENMSLSHFVCRRLQTDLTSVIW